MPLLFALDRLLIVSPAALLTSLILVSRETLLQSAASGPVRSDIINGLGAGTDGGSGNPSLFPSMTTSVVPGSLDSASAPLSSGCGIYLPTQSQASYRSSSSSPSARRHSCGFDVDNEEADVRANIAVADGHADIRARAVMTDQFGWRAPASLGDLARHASSARSRLHDHQRGLAEGRAAQPHGSAGEDGGFHASIEKVLRK